VALMAVELFQTAFIENQAQRNRREVSEEGTVGIILAILFMKRKNI